MNIHVSKKGFLFISLAIFGLAYLGYSLTKIHLTEKLKYETPDIWSFMIGLPEDYYEPYFIVPLDFNNGEITGKFQIKYYGRLSLGVKVEKKIVMPMKSYDWGDRYLVSYISNGRIILIDTIGENPSYWYKEDKMKKFENGFKLQRLNSPRNLPLGDVIEYKIERIQASGILDSLYGKGWLYISTDNKK